jgi:ribosomal RNA assembly protein
MKKVPINSPKKIEKAISYLTKKLNVGIIVNKDYAYLEGKEVNEFLAEKIIEAVDFGFDPEDACLLRNENFSLEYINIKDHTHRKNLAEIRARIIGTEGKAKKTIELLTGSVIVIHGNIVGVIADSEHVSQTLQGIISLIQGSKHGNVFSYLERQNANLRKIDEEDLGLRDPKKDLKNLD